MSDLTLDDDRWSDTSFSSFQDGANQKEDLSSRYGMKLVVPVWCAFILLAAVLVVGVVYCSKRHETCRTKRRDGKLLICGSSLHQSHLLYSAFPTIIFPVSFLQANDLTNAARKTLRRY